MSAIIIFGQDCSYHRTKTIILLLILTIFSFDQSKITVTMNIITERAVYPIIAVYIIH